VHKTLVVDPVLSPASAHRIIEAFGRFPAYTPSGTGSVAKKRERREGRRAARQAGGAGATSRTRGAAKHAGFTPSLDQRVDARLNFLRQGGLTGSDRDPLLAARHRYMRETLLDGDRIYAPGIEEYLSNRQLAEAARQLYGCDLVQPWNVYANVMLPGQELGLHTDTPEFRGAHRDFLPAWLLCAMHLSGLFERWRVRIATGITYLTGDEASGAFICYPDGPRRAPVRLPALRNSALVLDTDSVFHAVERVSGDDDPIRHIDANSRLVRTPKGRWALRCGEPGRLERVATYSGDELRVSLSWKAYCFVDEAERAARTADVDALTIDRVLDMMVDELIRRDRLRGPDHGLSDDDLGLLIIDEFIDFPPEPPRSSVTRPTTTQVTDAVSTEVDAVGAPY
jgi:hypothetical protein